MSPYKALALLIGLAIFCLVAMAHLIAHAQEEGQMKCGPTNEMLAELENRYHEVPYALGVAGPMAVIFTANPKTGTWTLAVSGKPPGGGPSITCFGASGDGWQFISEPKAPAPGDPT